MTNATMEKLKASTKLEKLLSPRAMELLRAFTYHRLSRDGSSGTIKLWHEFIMECAKDSSCANHDSDIYKWLMKVGLQEKEAGERMDQYSSWLYALRTAKEYAERGTLLNKDEPVYRDPGSF